MASVSGASCRDVHSYRSPRLLLLLLLPLLDHNRKKIRRHNTLPTFPSQTSRPNVAYNCAISSISACDCAKRKALAQQEGAHNQLDNNTRTYTLIYTKATQSLSVRQQLCPASQRCSSLRFCSPPFVLTVVKHWSLALGTLLGPSALAASPGSSAVAMKKVLARQHNNIVTRAPFFKAYDANVLHPFRLLSSICSSFLAVHASRFRCGLQRLFVKAYFHQSDGLCRLYTLGVSYLSRRGTGLAVAASLLAANACL